MSLGNDLVSYLGGLRLVGGDRDGQTFEVLGWQRRFLQGAFRRSGDSALSVARGNGKSALVAGIASAVVDPGGPLHGPARSVICAAASFEQGRIVFEDTLSYLRGRGLRPGRPEDVAKAGQREPVDPPASGEHGVHPVCRKRPHDHARASSFSGFVR